MNPISYSSYTETSQMSPLEVLGRGSVSITLGALPYAVYAISYALFKTIGAAAYGTNEALRFLLQDNCKTARRFIIVTSFGPAMLLTGVIMTLFVMLFGESQRFAWGDDLVKNPPNRDYFSLLAQWSATDAPWDNFMSYFAFESPRHNTF